MLKAARYLSALNAIGKLSNQLERGIDLKRVVKAAVRDINLKEAETS
ncbi:TPA: hypothetical protein ACGO6E_000605 [Streptococcus suis]